jgi:hypothetical protein
MRLYLPARLTSLTVSRAQSLRSIPTRYANQPAPRSQQRAR